MNDFEEITPDSLLYGAIHEIGHIIAALLCFPKKHIFEDGFVFHRNSENRYVFNTPFKQECLPYLHAHLDSYAIVCLAGGVFQQMVVYHQMSKIIGNSFNETESRQKNQFDAWEMFLCRVVKADFDGMEGDYELIERAISDLKNNGIQTGVNYEEIKRKAIHYLLPYLFSERISRLFLDCKQCLEEEVFCMNRFPVKIGMKFIGKYILDESGEIIKE